MERPIPSTAVFSQFPTILLPPILSLLTPIIRILLIPAINILLLQEPMASTMPHLQMRIVYRHHFPGLATHTHLHTTTLLPKHLHHANARLLPANTVARERSARKYSEISFLCITDSCVRFAAQAMKALLKVAARTASVSINSASSIQCHRKVHLSRLPLSMVHRLATPVARILKETIVHHSADIPGMENHRCCMELMENH